MRIGYLSEPVADYQKGLDLCTDVDALKSFLDGWRLLANDAWAVAQTMTTKDWKPYQKGLRTERRGKYSGDAWAANYADILMPDLMFHVSLIAQRFHCPWGLAYCRAKEAGKIVEENGIAIWIEEAK